MIIFDIVTGEGGGGRVGAGEEDWEQVRRSGSSGWGKRRAGDRWCGYEYELTIQKSGFSRKIFSLRNEYEIK